MPNLNQNQNLEPSKYRKPLLLDPHQLEYAGSRILFGSVLIFAAAGTCVAVAYMTFQQLKK